MKSKRYFSITKFGESINEDALLVRENMVAISDGAGGGGVFADEWSRYLVDNLPVSPFSRFEEFDNWVNGISDAFYDSHEIIAKQKGGIFLDKFYDEGAFATLVAVWRVASCEYVWVSYGDSVAFAYNPVTNTLEHSFSHLADFNQPPHLISLISPLNREGFRTGRFTITPGTFVFVASDALAHYIMARFEKQVGNLDEVAPALEARSRNSSYIKNMTSVKDKGFYEGVVNKLFQNANNPKNSSRILMKLYSDGLLGLDDYSIAFMPRTGCDTEYNDGFIAKHLDIDIPEPVRKKMPKRIEEFSGTIDSLKAFHDLRDTLSHYKDYTILYRGHADYSWELIPTLMREPAGSCEAEREVYPKLRKLLIEKGYDKFRMKGFNDDLYYLGLGRHLGLKSRLLDWTAGIEDSIDAFLLDEKYLKFDGALWLMFIPKYVEIEKCSPFDIVNNDIHVFTEAFFSPDGTRIKDFPVPLRRRFRQHGFFTATSEQNTHLPLDKVTTNNGILFIKLLFTPDLKKLLIKERDKKIYQSDLYSREDFKTWYLGEEDLFISKEIEILNQSIVDMNNNQTLIQYS